jgi:nicotinamidase-related amidase
MVASSREIILSKFLSEMSNMNEKKALLIIDMINDFVLDGAPLQIPKIKKVVKNIKREIEKARIERYAIIYVCDCHERDDKEFIMFPPHALKNTEGAKIIEDLKPQGSDIIVRKNTFSGFLNTDLDEILEKLSIEKLIIAGCVTNICVLYTAAGAVFRGYKVNIVKDAVIGLNLKDHKYALEHMKDVLKVNII